jgi:PAS domain S-box-containing protein
MGNKQPHKIPKVKCWEFFQCKKKNCPAYKSKDLRCWLFSRTQCRDTIQGKFIEKIEACLECNVFRTNIDDTSLKHTCKIINEQFREFKQLVRKKDKELRDISMELALEVTIVFDALKKIASGDPTVRIKKTSKIELLKKLKHMVNLTAREIGAIVDQSHEIAIAIAEHFDVLQKVSKGELSANVSGKSKVELLQALKKLTNEMIRSISEEINERKKSENILSSSFNALDGLLVVLDRDFRVILSNWKGHDFVPEQERQGHPHCYRIFKHRETPCDYCPPRDTFSDGKFRIYEDKNPVDGSYKEISVSPVLDNAGEVVWIIEHVRDITGRKHSEQALRETEQKLRHIIEHSNELYYVHDTHHVLSYASPQSLQMLGYTPEEMMIEWTRLATDNPINKKGIEITEKALKTGEKQDPYLLELRKKDGNPVLLEIDESPIRNDNGNVIGIVGAARDVTERMKADDEIKKRVKELEEFYDMAVGRELRMKQLKEEIEELKEALKKYEKS